VWKDGAQREAREEKTEEGGLGSGVAKAKAGAGKEGGMDSRRSCAGGLAGCTGPASVSSLRARCAITEHGETAGQQVGWLRIHPWHAGPWPTMHGRRPAVVGGGSARKGGGEGTHAKGGCRQAMCSHSRWAPCVHTHTFP
jgi:hypothetical protein